MNLWKAVMSKVVELVRRAAYNPPTTFELAICCLIGVLVCLLVLGAVARAMGAGLVSRIRTVVVGVLILAVGLSAAAMFELYLADRVARLAVSSWMPILAVSVALLVVGVPTARFLYRMNFVTAFITVLLASSAAVVAVVLVGAGLRSLRVTLNQFFRAEKQRPRCEWVDSDGAK